MMINAIFKTQKYSPVTLTNQLLSGKLKTRKQKK